MGNMLKFELRRLLKKPVFYVMLGLCVGVAIFMVFSMRISMDYMIQHMGESEYYAYGIDENYVKENFVENLSPQKLVLSEFWYILPTVLAVFVGIFVCEDRVRGTIKNIYARGYSRTSVFLAKFIVSSATSVLLYWLVIAAIYLSGMIVFATAPFEVHPQTVKGFWLLILGRTLVLLAANAGYFMLSELIGSTGFSIAANIFAPSILNRILYLGLSFVFYVVIQDNSFDRYDVIEGIIEYWIYMLVMNGFDIDMKVDAYVWHMIASGAYLLLFIFLGWLIARKKEVKN